VTLPCCPRDRYEGKVIHIGAAVDKDSRTLKVRALVPNTGGVLKGEMFVKVSIDTGSSQALTLPQSAIQRSDGATFVLLEKGKGEYERRPVRTGSEFNDLTEILEGVTPQDRVVSTGGILLKRNARWSNTSSFALRQRFITLALVLLLTVMGAVSFRNLPIEAYPDVGDVRAEIITL
jgi:multidrug efflux pump subunit AcrA (membrane-fusion protein)